MTAYGGTLDDLVVNTAGDVQPSRRLRFYTDSAMTTEHTAFFIDTARTVPLAEVRSDSAGYWPRVHVDPAVGPLWMGAERQVDGVWLPPLTVRPVVARDVVTEQGASGTYVARTTRSQHLPALGLFFPEAEGAVGDGVTDDAAAIRAAEAAALGAGGVLYAEGVYAIASTVKIRCHAKMFGATLNYLPATGTALILGETDGPGDGGPVGNACWEQRVEAPRVMAKAKTTFGWAQVAGTIGIHVSNSFGPLIMLNEVRDFEVGLKVGGQSGRGVGYGNFHGGHLYNNKVNLLLASDYASLGYSNENRFYGIRHSHNSGEGSIVVGTRHVKIAAQTTGYEITNNLWIGPSLESPGVVEFAVEFEDKGATTLVEARANRFIQPRLEMTGTQPRIKWGGSDNVFDGGLNLRFVIWSYTSGYVAGRNKWLGEGMSYEPALSTNGGRITENPNQNDGAVHTQLRAGGMQAGDDPATAYVWQQTSNGSRWKRFGDAFARLWSDSVNGRWYVGPGTVAPTAYVGAFGTGSMTLAGELVNIPGALNHAGTTAGFFNKAPVSRPVLSYSRTGESAAEAALRGALAALGLVTDSTVA